MPLPPARQVVLRPTEPEDWPALYRMGCDPESNELAGTKARTREAFMARWAEIARDPTVIARTIWADGALAGSVNQFVQDGRNSIGYWIDREHWGRGIATRAVGLMLAESATRPLYATASAGNAASLRVLARHGFEVLERRQSPETERYLARETVTLVLR